MKKKLVFIALLAVLLTFTFLSCEEEEAAWQVRITDIPSTYNGKYGYVGLSASITSDNIIAVSLPVTISGGQFTGDLLDANRSTSSNIVPFTTKGTYAVVLIITSDSGGQNIQWSGYKVTQTFSSSSTNISYNNFSSTSSIKILNSIKTAVLE